MSRRRRRRTAPHDPLIPVPACAGTGSAGIQQKDWVPAFAGTSGSTAPVSIRIARSDDDVVAIHRFMIAHAAAEMAEADVDALIYMRTIHDTVTQGAGLIAMIGDEIAGYLGLWKSQYDYAKASFLHDRGFYVLPRHRGGAVGAALLRDARAIADDAGLALKIIDTNPNKRRAKSRIGRTAEIIGYVPAGRIITFHPNEAA